MYKELFQMPKPTKIASRSSSITNAFINGIVPCIFPSEDEVKSALEILGMNIDTIRCSYCGDKQTEWDHFRPLILDKRATGYISEISNLVPACGKCNQSKGNKNWRVWMLSDAKLSPKSRGISNLDEKIQCLSAYENWRIPTKIDFEKIVGAEKWSSYMKSWTELLESMNEAQNLSSEIKDEILNSLNQHSS
jgi:hypothetical protein